MKLKSFSIIIILATLLTACPYQSEYVLGEKTAFDTDLIGTYTLDSSKFVVEKLVFKIDSNAHYNLDTYSKESGEKSYSGKLITSTLGKTKILNFKLDDISSQYYYLKYEVKAKTLQLQFLSQKKMITREPDSKAQFNSIYVATSKQKIWAFKMRLKRKEIE